VREFKLAAHNPRRNSRQYRLSSLSPGQTVLPFEYPQKAIDTQVAIA